MEQEIAIFAAGCFWGVEDVFGQLPGVVETEVGYTDGHTENPTYEQICGKKSGHAEAVRLVFNPAEISYETLVNAFFQIHDPTQLNRQGPDIGDQYRTAIYYLSDTQREIAEAYVAQLEADQAFPRPIVTEIKPAALWWPAEDYHQKYFAKRGGGACHVMPKI